MLINLIFKEMFVVCLITSSIEGLKDILLCGDPLALEVYELDKKICCDKKLFERVDNKKRERACCSNTLFYTDESECLDGKLQSVTLNRRKNRETNAGSFLRSLMVGKISLVWLLSSTYLSICR